MVKLINSIGKKRYMLIDGRGVPVPIALRFIKFKDNGSKARNTLRNYCYNLRHYFEFLEQKGVSWGDGSIDILAEFIAWLQLPHENIKVTPIRQMPSKRSPQTINLILDTVLNFYDYIMRVEDLSKSLSEKFKTSISGNHIGVKGFLYHTDKDKKYPKKILRLSEPKKKIKRLHDDQIQMLMDACNNDRDKLLIHLLWETGMRIGEALALWLEDINIGDRTVCICDRGQLDNDAEIKTVSAPRKLDISESLVNHLTDHIVQCHTDDVNINYIFFKMAGPLKYSPLDYQSVYSLVRRLVKKTGIKFTPHMMRHTNLNNLREAGMREEVLQKRAGHKNILTTKRMYYEISDEEVRQEWLASQRNKPKGQAPKEDSWTEDF